MSSFIYPFTLKDLSICDKLIEYHKNNTEYKNIYEDWKSNIQLFNEYHRYSDNEYMKLRLKNT